MSNHRDLRSSLQDGRGSTRFKGSEQVLPPPRAVMRQEILDEVITVTDEDAIDTARRLARGQ
ncbi:MAG: hypothetical protein U9Q94_02500 [Candidatus Bipolaricaulota bacterium]|nr:hypothetical protein [Candidatus Bipolaricaulota bacterium]